MKLVFNNKQEVEEFISTIPNLVFEINNVASIKENYNKVSEILELKTARIEELETENSKLSEENARLNVEVNSKDHDLTITKKEFENAKTQYEKAINCIDYHPVNQFNDTAWGDNYPSLKVLFDYLQENLVIGNMGWSFFTDRFKIRQDGEKINLSSKNLTKSVIGYLLYLIKDFFKPDLQGGRNLRYHKILKRIFILDNKPIPQKFFENHVHGYANKEMPKILNQEKENLISLKRKIESRYIEL